MVECVSVCYENTIAWFPTKVSAAGARRACVTVFERRNDAAIYTLFPPILLAQKAVSTSLFVCLFLASVGGRKKVFQEGLKIYANT